MTLGSKNVCERSEVISSIPRFLDRFVIPMNIGIPRDDRKLME